LPEAAVPRSAKYLQLEDKDGNQLWRIVVLSVKLENYMAEAKKAGIQVKRFTYDIEKFKTEQENKTKLESKLELLKVITVSNNTLLIDQLIIQKLLCLQ
jgi:hypothetical protein